MIPITTYRDKKVAVFGLGRTGLSAVRALVAGGASVLVWDDDPNRRSDAGKLGATTAPPTAEAWQGIAALVLSPGVPLTHPQPHPVVGLADSLGAEILGDVELFARGRPAATGVAGAALAAITGTNGKSTTTSLLAHILSASGREVEAGANLGRPVLDFEVLGEAGVYVLELSSYQIDLTTGLRPDVVALLNITPDHLDRHGGMDGYIAAKRRLLDMAGPGATLVIGVDDGYSARIAQDMAAKGCEVLEVSVLRELAAGIFVKDGQLFRSGTATPIADLNGIETLRGAHNWQNAAVAFALAEVLGLTPSQIIPGLSSYPGLPHRMEVVARHAGVLFVNDSKATNAEAAAHALAAYDNIFWIVGGIAKQGGIDSLAPHYSRIARAFLIGEAADAFAQTLNGVVDHEMSGDLDTAVQAAHDAAVASGGVVLLSPACASFDQFASFEARGDRFRELARHIVQGENGNPCRVAGGAL